MTRIGRVLSTGILLAAAPGVRLYAQTVSPVSAMAVRLASMTAVTGYEAAMVDTLLHLLPGSVRDRAGSAVLRLGTGTPKRLVLCPLDEPGYVVGSSRDDGYLTLRRVPGQVFPLFDQQLEGHRVTIQGSRGPVPGVVAVRSIHLTRGREAPNDQPFTVDDAYVDVGAGSATDAAELGIAVLAPVTLAKRPQRYGKSLLAAPVAGRRAACAALLMAAGRQSRDTARSGGTTVVAFAVEEGLAERGLATLANTLGPFVETLIVDGAAGARGGFQQVPDTLTSARWGGLGTVTRWSLPVGYAGTAVETVSLSDADSVSRALATWIGGSQ